MKDSENYKALLKYWSGSTVRKNRPVSERHLAQLAKRGFDVISASAMLILTLPFMLVAAAAIALDGGPIFYLGNRIGAKEVAFKFFKFRTMLPDADLCLEEYLEHHPSARREWLQDRKFAFDPPGDPGWENSQTIEP
jgi:lipopolysaccharide/colanic/teichoic acid biosynthesis glycosyltransferase